MSERSYRMLYSNLNRDGSMSTVVEVRGPEDDFIEIVEWPIEIDWPMDIVGETIGEAMGVTRDMVNDLFDFLNEL